MAIVLENRLPMPKFVIAIVLSKMRVRSRTRDADASDRFRRWDECWVIFCSLAYLSFNLFQFSTVPVLLGGDQVFFWMDAQRMMHGDRIYRDFFQFTGPGTDLIYLGAFHLFGTRVWVPNIIVLVLGVILGWTCFRIGTKILPRPMAFLATASVVVVLYGRLLNATHHWFSELAVLMAVFVLMKGSESSRVILAGLLLGVATFFTQSRGPTAAFAVAAYFLWEGLRTTCSWPAVFRRIVLLACTLALVWIVLSSYFVVTLGWQEIWYWQVTYVLRYQVGDHQFLGLPTDFRLNALPFASQVLTIYLALPVAFGTSLLHAWSSRHEPPTRVEASRVLLTLVGIANALEVAQSPNWLRVYCVAPPGILLTAWLVGRLGGYKRTAKVLLWTAIVVLALDQIRSQHRHESVLVKTPAGTASTSSLKAEKLIWIERHTRAGDYFFQAPWPGVYLPLQLRNPVFAEAFRNDDLTRPEFVTLAIDQLEKKHVRYVLWSPQLDSQEPLKSAGTYHLGPFRDFLYGHYQKVWTFSDGDQIWQRK